jgi:hypothetical protein
MVNDKDCWFGFSGVQWPAFVKGATDLLSKYLESTTTNDDHTYQTTIHSITPNGRGIHETSVIIPEDGTHEIIDS